MFKKERILKRPITFDNLVEQLVARTNIYPQIILKSIKVSKGDKTGYYKNVYFNNVKEGKIQVRTITNQKSVISMEYIDEIEFK